MSKVERGSHPSENFASFTWTNVRDGAADAVAARAAVRAAARASIVGKISEPGDEARRDAQVAVSEAAAQQLGKREREQRNQTGLIPRRERLCSHSLAFASLS